MSRSLAAAVWVFSTAAAAQTAPLETRVPSWVDRCYGGPNADFSGGWYFYPPYYRGSEFYASRGNYHPAVPVDSSPSGGSGSSSGGGGGGGLGNAGPEALLVAAVALAVALPVVIYVLDSEPDDHMLRRYECPGFTAETWAGVESSSRSSTVIGIGAVHVQAAVRFLAADVRADTAYDGALSNFSASLMLRPPPKKHLEGGFSFGYRRSSFGGVLLEGFEVGVAQRYTLWHSNESSKDLALELRPVVFIHQTGWEVGVESAILIPVFDFVSVRVQSRLWSFRGETLLGFGAGLNFHL